jgi:hypothetical protein
MMEKYSGRPDLPLNFGISEIIEKVKRQVGPKQIEIPITIHFADNVKIFGDRLYILEKDNEMCVYEYRIIELNNKTTADNTED